MTNDSTLASSLVPCYDDYKHVLLLGEADFSFCRAFCQHFDGAITATEYGDCQDVAQRYFDGSLEKLNKSLSSLPQDRVHVLAGLNARLLGNIKEHQCTGRPWNADTQTWNAKPTLFWNHLNDNNNNDKFDLIIFNFPHSDQAGRAKPLIRALFKQVRLCIEDGRLAVSVVVEMRLRVLESDPTKRKNVRSFYKHEESAEESGFVLIDTWTSDLEYWEALGYQHRTTKRNATCLDIGESCKIWRWKSRCAGS